MPEPEIFDLDLEELITVLQAKRDRGQKTVKAHKAVDLISFEPLIMVYLPCAQSITEGWPDDHD